MENHYVQTHHHTSYMFHFMLSCTILTSVINGESPSISPIAVFPMTTFDYWRVLGPPIPTASWAHHPHGIASRMNLLWNLFKSLSEENPVVDVFSIWGARVKERGLQYPLAISQFCYGRLPVDRWLKDVKG